MLNILFIAHQFPYPLDVGSRIRIFNLIKAYAAQYKVTLVSYIKDNEQLQYIPILMNYCKEIHVVPMATCIGQQQNRSRYTRVLSSLFNHMPVSITSFYSEEMQEILEKLDIASFDIIHVERIFMGMLIEHAFKDRKMLKIVFDFDDYQSRKMYRDLKLQPFSVRKALDTIEMIKFRLYERRLIPKFTCCMVCSEVDRKLIQERKLSGSLIVVPNGADTQACRPRGLTKDQYQVLYLGSMDYEPNNDAVIFFCKEVLPVILRSVPQTKFVIAGQLPQKEVLNLHNGINILVKGFVEDARTLVEQSALLVVPLRSGGGTRLKILEALAMKTCVVSTSIGCEGIEVTDGVNIAIADGAEQFANKCVELLKDEGKRVDLQEEGRRLVEEKYDWHMIGANLCNDIAKLGVA
jgi:glycosyltransferase involved in cell wall biosynthesis